MTSLFLISSLPECKADAYSEPKLLCKETDRPVCFAKNGAHRYILFYLLVIITKPSNYAMIYVSFDDIHKSQRNQALIMVV